MDCGNSLKIEFVISPLIILNFLTVFRDLFIVLDFLRLLLAPNKEIERFNYRKIRLPILKLHDISIFFFMSYFQYYYLFNTIILQLLYHVTNKRTFELSKSRGRFWGVYQIGNPVQYILILTPSQSLPCMMIILDMLSSITWVV